MLVFVDAWERACISISVVLSDWLGVAREKSSLCLNEMMDFRGRSWGHHQSIMIPAVRDLRAAIWRSPQMENLGEVLSILWSNLYLKIRTLCSTDYRKATGEVRTSFGCCRWEIVITWVNNNGGCCKIRDNCEGKAERISWCTGWRITEKVGQS